MHQKNSSYLSNQLLFILDDYSHDILDVNEAVLEKYGYSYGELCGMNFYDLGERSTHAELINELNENNSIWVHRSKNGEEFFVQLTYHQFNFDGQLAKFAVAHDVSEQINHQESDPHQYPKLETHKANFPLAEIGWDANYAINYWSEQAEELLGWKEEEAKGEKAFLEHILPENALADWKETCQKSIEEQQTQYTIESKIRTKGGQVRYYKWYNSLLYDEYGSLRSVRSLITDITENRESQNLFRALSEESLVGIFLIQDGVFRYVNPRFADIFGYGKEDIENKYNISDLAYPDDQKKVQQNITDHIHKVDESVEYGFRVITKNNEVIHVNIFGSPIEYAGVPAVVGTLVDTTHNKKIVKQYRSSLESFKDLFDSISDAIYIQDKEGRFLEINGGAEEMYGYKRDYFIGKTPEFLAAKTKVDLEQTHQLIQKAPIGIAFMNKDQELQFVNESFTNVFGFTTEEIKGKNIDEVIVPEDAKSDAYEVSKRIYNGNTAQTSGKRRCKDGSIVDVLIYGVPVKVQGETITIYGLYVDVTENKKAENKIKESLKEKEVLLAEIHHRVKNNLAVITGLLELQAYNTTSEEAVEVLKESQMRINSIALIHEKLYQREDLSQISFDTYVEQLLKVVISSMHTDTTNVDVHIDAQPLDLTVNQAIPCGLILNELITNAYKHAFKGKTEGNIWISVNDEEDLVSLNVRDDGVGMPKDLNITKPKSLGLQLINTLSEQLQGQISYIPENSGTHFQIQFYLEE